jgi:hypothetical protein
MCRLRAGLQRNGFNPFLSLFIANDKEYLGRNSSLSFAMKRDEKGIKATLLEAWLRRTTAKTIQNINIDATL